MRCSPKSIKFSDLGLVMVDEEQHFGVVHKERLKALKADVHVLTLTATPIPAHVAIGAVGRARSVADHHAAGRPAGGAHLRHAVRSAGGARGVAARALSRRPELLSSRPRIADLREAEAFLKETVPEVKTAVAHGQMAPSVLEDVMTAFYERKIDVLISTNIVESGLDIPTANTMIVQRADMFGLSQLYQIAGPHRPLQGARLCLSHHATRQEAHRHGDTPAGSAAVARSAGRGLFRRQPRSWTFAAPAIFWARSNPAMCAKSASSFIRRCWRRRCRRCAKAARARAKDDQWSPSINLGAAVLIPEDYVADLNVRMSLYRRLSGLQTRADIDAFAAELIDRFGPLPDEVKHLFEIVAIKQLALTAGVEKIDAGPKGGTISFRNNSFANPAALIALISRHSGTMKVRPDQKIVVTRDWPTPDDRLNGAKALLTQLAKLAA